MNTKNYISKIGIFLLSILSISQVNAQLVITNDSIYNTAHQMWLANELFESGEPFAEALGYNLDDLDPMVPNSPDSVSYTTGIEGYEYSRYLLNTLNGRSGMGLHMMWSPVIKSLAAMQPTSFDGQFTGGMINGYKEDDQLMMMVGSFGMNANQTPPQNPYPQFADFISGNTKLPQTVATDFQMDWATTRWDRSKMVKVLNLAAMGQSLWKQYYWAADMLSAFHDGNNVGIEADGTNSPDSVGKPNLDPANNIFYGGNNIDGFIGQVLTAVSINKTMLIMNNLAYDGTALGAVDPMTYNPANGIQYFPTKISLTENIVSAGLPPAGSDFTVIDAKSQLFDQISYLLGTASYTNMMDPANSTDAAHFAYHEVFDGNPFPAPMSVTGTAGPFDLMKGMSMVLFQNIMAMHYNSTAGTFVNESSLNGSGQAVLGAEISAENAAYTILALSKFSDEFVGTPLKAMADNAIVAQADFILNNFVNANGSYYNLYVIGTGANNAATTVEANAAIVRGLYAAYVHTNNSNYLTAANLAYNYLINNFYVASEHAFKTTLGENTAIYTPKTLALIAGALREAKLVGNQTGAEVIYMRFSKKGFNAMLLSEHESTGETGGDSDGDGIPYVAGGTKPFVFADEAHYTFNSLTTGISTANQNVKLSIYPNPASVQLHIILTDALDKIAEISIYNQVGQKVISLTNVKNNAQDISLEELSKGSYFVRIRLKSENLLIQKIIKN